MNSINQTSKNINTFQQPLIYYMDSKDLKKLFNPYCQKYSLKTKVKQDMFPGLQWITINGRLTEAVIRQAYNDKIQAAWFSTYSSMILAVDVDDHRQRAWENASPHLLALYDSVLRKLAKPSLLVQSPRGLHLYWILSFPIPTDDLRYLASEKLKGLPVEIKYTPTESLRIPGKRRFRDVLTFEFLSQVDLDKLVIYHPAELLGEDCLPGNLSSYQDRTTKLGHAKIKWSSIEEAEKSILPIETGKSNEQFLNLIVIYRCAGLSTEEAYKQFQWALQRSPGYLGELVQKPARLWEKIRCEYRHNIRPPLEKGYAQKWLADDSIINNLISLQPFSKQREKPIQRFLSRIIWANNLHREMLGDKRMMARMRYIYTPFHQKNVEKGYIPLSKTFLQNVNYRYNQIMAWLERINFIEPMTFEYKQGGQIKAVQYSYKLGLCKYYRLNEDKFI